MFDICKIKKIVFKKQGYSGGRIYLTVNKKIIKSMPIKKDLEEKWLDKIKDNIDHNISILFNPYLEKKKCYKYTYYLFNKLDDDLIELLKSKKLYKEDLKNIMMQCLLSIYILNNELNFFHNDFANKMRNFMYIKNKNNKAIINVGGFKVKIGKYNVKLIDFNKSDTIPKGETLKYYIEDLEIISECFLLGLTFFSTIIDIHNIEEFKLYLVDEYNNILNRLGKNYTIEKFDKEIISFYMKNFDDIFKYYN